MQHNFIISQLKTLQIILQDNPHGISLNHLQQILLEMLLSVSDDFPSLQSLDLNLYGYTTLNTCLVYALSRRDELQKFRTNDFEHQMQISSHRWEEIKSENSQSEYQLFGDIIDIDESTGLQFDFTEWDERILTTSGQEKLVEVLKQMQEISKLLHGESPTFSINKASIRFILTDLLRLPPLTNPIQWLLTNRFHEIVQSLAADLLRALVIDPHLIRQSNIIAETIHPQQKAQYQMFSCVVNDIEFHELGSVIHLRSKFPSPKSQQKNTSVYWSGFEQLFDSNGKKYIIQPVQCGIGECGRRPIDKNLIVVCWPVLPHNCSFTLRTEALTLNALTRKDRKDDYLAETGINIGPALECTFTL